MLCKLYNIYGMQRMSYEYGYYNEERRGARTL